MSTHSFGNKAGSDKIKPKYSLANLAKAFKKLNNVGSESLYLRYFKASCKRNQFSQNTSFSPKISEKSEILAENNLKKFVCKQHLNSSGEIQGHSLRKMNTNDDIDCDIHVVPPERDGSSNPSQGSSSPIKSSGSSSRITVLYEKQKIALDKLTAYRAAKARKMLENCTFSPTIHKYYSPRGPRRDRKNEKVLIIFKI